jgi:CRISPR-associated exonuclease Cas4
MTFVYLVVLALLVAGALLWWWSGWLRRQTGLPAGAVRYSDTGVEKSVAQPLLSRRYGIVGKPDYLLEVKQGSRTMTVPVEVKSRRQPPEPAAHHVLQLAAYCLLVEDVLGQRPTHGVLRYADATLTIPYTDNLRRQVLAAADELRRARHASPARRSHNLPQRCAACGYSQACGAECLTSQVA